MKTASSKHYVERTIKIQHALADKSSNGTKVCLLDSPGCNEYGSEFITECSTSAKEITSAFIFVTTFEDYAKLSGSKILQSIYEENRGTIWHNVMRSIHCNNNK